MVVFDVSNVLFVWDDSLVGRPCYFADSLDALVSAVTSQDNSCLGFVAGFGSLAEPFSIAYNGIYSVVYPVDDLKSWSYNKVYVHFEWDDSLEGRRCLMSNTIGEIISLVHRNASPWPVFNARSNTHPFKDTEGKWYRFAYFDPYYDFRYAMMDGEPVECLCDGEWGRLEHCVFLLPPSHYRFESDSIVGQDDSLTEPSHPVSGASSKESVLVTSPEVSRPGVRFSGPEESNSEKAEDVPAEASGSVSLPVTNLELARWLVEGHGYCCDSLTGGVVTNWRFDLTMRDCPFNASRYHLMFWD